MDGWLNVPGDGTATYAVSLATRPMADVVVSLDTGSGLTVDAACDSDEEAPACVRFTPDDWNVARPIAVTGTADGRTWISHTVASDDLKYDGLSAPGVTVLVGDNAGGFDVFLPMATRE